MRRAAKKDKRQTEVVPEGLSRCKRGEEHPKAKLTEKQVIEIRERYARGNVLQRQLGKIYGVSETHIGRIVRFEKWAHVEATGG